MKMSSNFLHSVSILFFFISFSATFAENDSRNDFFRCLTTTNSYELSSIASVTFAEKNSSYQTLFYSTVINSGPLSRSSVLKPIAIITPLEESQIPLIVSCAKSYGIQIRTRSGGHDFEGLSFTSDSTFIILDMRNLRSISIDAEKKTAWAQTGTTLGELYYAIANTSRTLAFPAGACPTVCVGGHISGGGFGLISRKYGLAIDHVIDARIVDVNGRILDRESMGEDLFWAIRGGGGASFGVILAWKLNLVSIPEIVTGFNITRTSDPNVVELLLKHQQIGDKIDDRLVLRLNIKSRYDEVKGNQTVEVVFRGLYLGRVDTLLQLMQENFPELGLLREDCTEMSWIDSVMYIWMFPGGSTPEVLLNRTKDSTIYYKVKSDFLTEPMPKEGILWLWKKIHERNAFFELLITPYGGRMSEIPESDLPFPHRLGTRYTLEYTAGWNQSTGVQLQDNKNAQISVKWLRELHKYMGLYASKNPRGAYWNYPDLDLGSEDEENAAEINASIWGVKYFKNNFERLVQVKTKVDPTNFFKNELSIPVSHHFDSKNIKEVTEKNAYGTRRALNNKFAK